MSKYIEFDQALISNIRYGYNTASQITSKMDGYCNDICEKREPYRVVDGRLQSLRKRGLISFSDGKWHAK